MVSTLLPMPSMWQPMELSRWQTSWTWGSLAALRRTVTPSARAAAMMPFSVAVTEASSSRMSQPCRRPSARSSNLPLWTKSGAQGFEYLEVRVDATSADVVSAGGGVDAEVTVAGEQRAHQRERAANLAEQVDVRLAWNGRCAH